MPMLGSQCSECCGCGCGTSGDLPDAVKVSFKGLTQSAIKTGQLLTVSLESCFGSGGAVSVTAPGGLPDSPGGKILSVSLDSGGSGYAVLGRTVPTGLSLFDDYAGGTGAQFSIALSEQADDCGRPYWKISGVKVLQGGNGYASNAEMDVSLGPSEVEDVKASLVATTTPSQPTLEASVQSATGSGALLTVTVGKVSSDPDRWGASKIEVFSKGSGYAEGDLVTVTPIVGQTQVVQGTGSVWMTRVEPLVSPVYFGNGTGANLVPTLTMFMLDGRRYWRCDGLVASTSGSGYQVNEQFSIAGVGDRTFTISSSNWQIDSVSVTGGILSLSRITAGAFWKEIDEIDRINVDEPGQYYGNSGTIESIAIVQPGFGGRYYKEDASLPPLVSPVTAVLNQIEPSDGSGAEIEVEVNETVGDTQFGEISKVTLTNEGDGYLGWSYNIFECSVVDLLNDEEFILRRGSAQQRVDRILGLQANSCFGGGAVISAAAKGGAPNSGGYPIDSVSILSGGSGYAVPGRVTPTGITLSPSGGSGSGATFSVSMSGKQVDKCGLPYWSVSSATIGKQGGGYLDGQLLYGAAGNNEFQITQAIAAIGTDVAEPTLAAQFSAPAGSGESVQVSVIQLSETPLRWCVDDVVVSNGGSGFSDNQKVTFVPLPPNGKTDIQGYGVAYIKRLEPAVVANYYQGNGSGASFTATLTKDDSSGLDIWRCSSVAIDSPGTGYVGGEYIYIEDQNANAGLGHTASIWQITVGQNGEIASLSQVTLGAFWTPTDEIDSISVVNPGSYYESTGQVQSIAVLEPGKYYKESVSAAPIVADIEVVVTQSLPSNGTGAKIKAGVDSDVSSPQFGQINSLTIQAAGDGYLGWSWIDLITCFYEACVGLGLIRAEYRGKNRPPVVHIRPKPGDDQASWCNILFEAASEAAPFECGGLEFEATEPFGGTANVFSADEEDAVSCSDLIDATSFEVTLSAQDYERQATRAPVPPPQFAPRPTCLEDGGWAGMKILGGDFNGTFSLEHVATDVYQQGGSQVAVKRYEYVFEDTECDFEKKLEMTVSSTGSVQLNIVGLLGYASFKYNSQQPGSYGCSGGEPCRHPGLQNPPLPPTGFSGEYRYAVSLGNSISSQCLCSLESMFRTLSSHAVLDSTDPRLGNVGLCNIGFGPISSNELPCSWTITVDDGSSDIVVTKIVPVN